MGRKQRDIILTEDKLKLVEQYIPYAKSVADKMNRGDSQTLSEAYWSLIYLANMYNEDNNARFGTFLKNYLPKILKTQLYRSEYIDWRSDLMVDIQSKYDSSLNYTYEEIIQSDTYNVSLNELYHNNTYKAVTEKLNEKQKEVFDLYVTGLPMKDVAKVIGRSRQTVCKIWKSILDIIHQDYQYEDFAY